VDEHEKECMKNNDNNGKKCAHTVHMLQEFYSPKDLRSLHSLIELVALNNDVFEKSHGGENLLFSMYYGLLNDISSWSLLSYKESITDTIDKAIAKLGGKRRKRMQEINYIENPLDFTTEKRKEMIEVVMKNVLAARGYVQYAYSDHLGT
jgi:hypothetical protein